MGSNAMTKAELAAVISANSPLVGKQAYDLAKVLHSVLQIPEPKINRTTLVDMTKDYFAKGGKITFARNKPAITPDLQSSLDTIVKGMR
jgi:hypothetical protein